RRSAERRRGRLQPDTRSADLETHHARRRQLLRRRQARPAAAGVPAMVARGGHRPRPEARPGRPRHGEATEHRGALGRAPHCPQWPLGRAERHGSCVSGWVDVMNLSRSRFLHLAGATLLARPALAQTSPPMASRMNTRKIPATGEQLPVVGVGTWQTFDVGASPAERAPRAEVLKALFEAGGSVIDSSPMYGRAEAAVGELLADAGTRSKAFLATKVWTHGRKEGIAQME